MGNKDISKLCVCFLFLIILVPQICFSQDIPGKARVLKSSSELDYPPFAIVTPDGKADGFSVELLRAVAEAVHFDVEFPIGPWHEIKKKLEAGEIDVLPLVSYSSEREKYFDFTVPYLRMHGTIFIRDTEKTIKSEEDLKGKEVLIMRDDTAHEYLLSRNLGCKIILTKDFEEAMKKLSEGKHDAVVIQQLVGLQIIKRLNLNNLIVANSVEESSIKPIGKPLCGFEQKFCIAVKEGNKELLALINEGLALVIANGKYNRLYDKWFGPIFYKKSVLPISFKSLFIGIVTFFLLSLAIGVWYLRREVERKTKHLKEEILERKIIEQEYVKSQEFLERVIQSSPIPMWISDPEGNILIVNEALCKTLDISKSHVVGNYNIFNDENLIREGVLEDVKNVYKNFQPFQANLNWVSGEAREIEYKEEKNLYISATFFPIDDNGVLKNVVCQWIDITEKRKAELELKEKERFLTNLLDVIPIPVFYKDREGRYMGINKAYQEFWKVDKCDVLGKTTAEIHPLEFTNLSKKIDDEIYLNKGSRTYENSLKMANGEIRECIYTKATFCDAEGKTIGLIGTIMDITERKRIEEQLQHAQKMTAIENLAGGIAHDFNNLLSVIIGNISFVLNEFVENIENKKMLNSALEGAKKAQGLTQQLLTFAKGGAPIKKIADLNKLIIEARDFVISGSKSKCDVKLDSELLNAEVDAGQIHQVLCNLLINANQAMPNGGSISISSSNIEIENKSDISLPKGKFVKISIKDEGVGISKEDLEKIFDPFFTTKENGNGLGLATTYSIIKQHGGLITVESEEKKGTCFNIYLPATNKTILIDDCKPGKMHHGQGRILIMDDMEDISTMLGKLLSRMGYDTVSVCDGKQAIEVYKKALNSPEPFGLVILDLTVPGGMGGAATIIELKKIDPKVKAVVSSGYSNDPIMANYEDYGFIGVVAKPYERKEFVELLNVVFKNDQCNKT